IAFEAAVMVVQPYAGENAHEPIENSRGADLMPRIVTHLFPAADAIQALIDFGQETRNLAGIILQVGVERQNELATGDGKAGRQSRRLPKISPKANPADPLVGRRQVLDPLPRAIG